MVQETCKLVSEPLTTLKLTQLDTFAKSGRSRSENYKYVHRAYF